MASSVFLVEGALPGKRGLMGAWSPFGCFAGTLLGSAAGLIVNTTLSPSAVMAYGWRIPFLFGLAVALGGIVIRRNFVEKVPHQPPAKSPLGESFRLHWRTILHLILLVAGLSVGFYTTFVYSATWLKQVAGVSAKTGFEINTIAMALSLGAVLVAGGLSDRFGRRPVVAVVTGLLMVVSYPLMAWMAGGQWIARFRRAGGPLAARFRGRRSAGLDDGGARAVAGALHRALDLVQLRRCLARWDDAAGRRVAGVEDRVLARAGRVPGHLGCAVVHRRPRAPENDAPSPHDRIPVRPWPTGGPAGRLTIA